MAFWNDAKIEPLRQYRWYLSLSNRGEIKSLQLAAFALKSCTKPEYEIGVTEHTLLTHTFRYPSILKWKPITLKYVSVNTDDKTSVSSILDDMLRSQAGYMIPTNGHQQISKESLVGSLDSFDFKIFQVDGSGRQVENWSVYNGFISSVKYGTLSYESEEAVEIELTIQYDFAELISP